MSPNEKQSTATQESDGLTRRGAPLSAAPAGAPAGDLAAAPRQRTLASVVRISGKGLLLGEDAAIEIHPAEPDTGVVFERVDLSPPVRIPATADCTVQRPRRTTLKMGDATIETVEHLLSAVAGLQVDNAVIRLRGPEVPCGDGSSNLFARPMVDAGFVTQAPARRTFRLREPVMVEDGDGMICAMPSDAEGMRVVYDLDYGPNAHRIRSQTFAFNPANGDYLADIAPSRTFSLREEAEGLWKAGMCRHLSPKDVLVIDEDGTPIDNAYRFDDEPVRHKILDVIGDLALVGCPVQCNVLAIRSGHALNRRLAAKLREQVKAVDLARTVATGEVMDIRAIQKVMPHRYPMLLVDRVVEIEGDRRAVGIKNVSINEPFFQGHYPGVPIMPGVLLVEAMAQLGGLLMSKTIAHHGKIAVLLSLDKVKLRRPVTPGDQVVLEAENIRGSSRTAQLRCRARVGDKIAAEAEIRFMMVDADQT